MKQPCVGVWIARFLVHDTTRWNHSLSPLIPAKAGIQGHELRRLVLWIPACAGMSGTCSRVNTDTKFDPRNLITTPRSFAHLGAQVPHNAADDDAGAGEHQEIEPFAIERPPDEGDQRDAQEIERDHHDRVGNA